jgi:hypothetical protein
LGRDIHSFQLIHEERSRVALSDSLINVYKRDTGWPSSRIRLGKGLMSGSEGQGDGMAVRVELRSNVEI